MEVTLFGNPNFLPEHLIAYEAGFRTQPNDRFSVDASAFYNQYDHLPSLEPGGEFLQALPAHFVMPITVEKLLYGGTEGGEIAANVKLTGHWTLSPGYAFLEMHLHTKPSRQDTTSVAEYQGSSPQHQGQLRSHVELFRGLSWDVNAYFIGALPVQGVASYTRLGTQLRWKLSERSEVAFVGQNLLQDHYLESNDQLTLVNPSLIKRSAYSKFTWWFW